MEFKVVTTFLDKPLKGSLVNKELLNPKAKRHWYKNEDEVISRGMKFVEQANRLLPDNASLRVYYEGDVLPDNMEKVEFVKHPVEKIEMFKKRADGKYIPSDEAGIVWNDKNLNIKWNLASKPIVSKKDLKNKTFLQICKKL